ncbi:UDP-N-acetylmuramoyl-tripeptide--D-alanyl-D-alanine ligase [candidate division WOR-3 bacterium]|nr:UDP-N-acetylmuramoyl-tripeptide--D-alanyl-D-alanine ligase [candidate division WOR-3 bacterium]
MDYELERIVSVTGAELHGIEPTIKASGFSTDSRIVGKGQIFVAIKGEKTDGHKYFKEALENGALAVMCEKKLNGPSLTVKNCVEAMGQLAFDRLSRSKAKIVGVTGSLGKTTAKEAIKSALGSALKVESSEGNMNTEIGLPLTILNKERDPDIFVLEMAARKIGDIEYLCEIAQPDISVVTQIAPVHLEIFGSMENITKAKLEIALKTKNGGFVVLNGDDKELSKFKKFEGKTVHYFGIEHQSVKDIRYSKEETSFTVQNHRVTVRVPAKVGLYAGLASLKVGQILGLEISELARGLSSMVMPPNRFGLFLVSGKTIIDDSYNSSPVALEAVMDYTSRYFTGKKIAVLGDMKELGEDSPRYHFEAGSKAAKKGFAEVIAVGDYAKDLCQGFNEKSSKNCHEAQNWKEALSILEKIIDKGDVILIKGSRVMELDKLALALKNGGKSV